MATPAISASHKAWALGSGQKNGFAGASKKQGSAVPKDTVTLSPAAETALQEAMESPEVTAREAAAGDPVARKLVAKAAAARQGSRRVHVVA